MQTVINEPKITIILRVHNRVKYYREALKSILEQDYEKNLMEIIVLTNIPSVLVFFNSFDLILTRVYFYENETEGEVLYKGLLLSRGDVISFLDDDDIWMSNRISEIANLFKNFSNVGYYHNSVIPFIDNDSLLRRKKYETLPKHGSLYVKNSDKSSLIRRLTGYYPDFNLSSICVRRSIVSLRIEDLKIVPTSPDTFLYFCAMESNADLFIDSKSLTYYRHHNLNLTANRPENLKWYDSILKSHTILRELFASSSVLLDKLTLRRLMLTNIQNSLMLSGTPRRVIFKNSIRYLTIFLYFLIPVDAYVFTLNTVSIFSHWFAQRIYFRFV